MADQSSLQFYYSGYEKCSAGHFFGPTVRVHYLIHLVINGKGLYQVGKNTYSVCTNQAFLIRPQEVTFTRPMTKILGSICGLLLTDTKPTA